MRKKIVSADDAARLVRDGDTLTTSGFVGIGVPDELLLAIERRFLDTGSPGGLGIVFAAGQGDGEERGLNRLGHDGLLKLVIGGHWGLIPKVGKLCVEGKLAGYNLPQGVISHLYRDIAAGKPGTVTHVGLGTFVDPRNDGGKINELATEDIVELIEIGGRELLFYKARPLDVALLRGTTADEAGNVTMEHEALVIDNLAQAMAVRNSGGVVIVQVERTVAPRTLSARDVVLPASLVDAVVVSEPDNHVQTYGTRFSHFYTNRYRAPEGSTPPMEMGPRKIIARRAAFELPINGVVNLGIGMPEGIADVAAEEGLLQHITLTAEPGVMGGQPASGLNFGAAVNTDAIIPQNATFDFYDGGGLDMTCLGMAQADAAGNVNVSRFGSRLAGAGGFINISQNARNVVFAGTFTAGGLSTAIRDGRLVIEREGKNPKFQEEVEQITHSGARSLKTGQPVLYVTERCVLELTEDGMKLVEVAPGIDVEEDILAQMGFEPIVDEVAEMDPRIFADGPMDLRTDLLHLDLDDRIALAQDGQVLFINFEKMRVRSEDDVDQIRERVEEICQPLDSPVDVVVNYDGARIDEDIEDAYAAMVHDLEERFYGTVTRYSGSAFMRMKLGRSVLRESQPHIFESGEEARAYLDRSSGG